MELPRLPGSETRLRDALHDIRDRYAFTLLDCPPSLGPLTVNALVAADRVIVPVQTEYFALEGLAGLLDTLALVQRELNPRLTVAGMLLTMHDSRTKLAQDVEREVREHFPALVFDNVIPRNVGSARPQLPRRSSITTRTAPVGGLLAWPRRWRSWLIEAWAAGCPRSAHPAKELEAERGSELREIPVDMITPNPHQPRREFGRGLESWRVRVPAGTGRAPAGARATIPGGVRADRRRASLARRAARRLRQRAPLWSGRTTDASLARARADRETWPARTHPVEEARACANAVRSASSPREDVGRASAARAWPSPTCCACSTCPPRCST